MKRSVIFWILAACLVASACSSSSSARRDHDADASHSVKRSKSESGAATSKTWVDASAALQHHLDSGLMLIWGFNHDESVREFERAQKLDPDNAMAAWGIAHALGPNRNLKMTSESKARRAYESAQRALELSEGQAGRDRALIEALATRYEDPAPEEREHLDQAYVDAMRGVYERFPEDPDVACLFADAILTRYPSKQWSPDGESLPGTDELVRALEATLAEHPNHAGACHLYVHAVEASPTPELALPAADRLMYLEPDLGHLVHMASHIYLRVGMYQKGIESNRKALEADNAYFDANGPQKIYEFYRAHNYHFLIWAAMFQGSSKMAMDAAEEMVGKLPRKKFKDLPRSIEAFLFVPYHVMMRFGRWDEVLAADGPPKKYPLARALWHHARAIAYANTGRIDEALKEASKFDKVAVTVPKDKKVRRATIPSILDCAWYMMKGEIRFHQGRHAEAFAALRQAIAAEDSMPYAEPPAWMLPIRHAYGALLLEAGRLEEAEQAYREDLARHHDNGWSLHGLAESLRRQGRPDEAREVEERFRKSWQYADTLITSSCFCRPVSGT